MHLVQHLSHHLHKQTLSRLTYGIAPAKGSNPVVTPKKNSDPLKQFQSSLAQKASISDIFQCI